MRAVSGGQGDDLCDGRSRWRGSPSGGQSRGVQAGSRRDDDRRGSIHGPLELAIVGLVCRTLMPADAAMVY